MILIDCEQGTEEWLSARAGVITASMVDVAISTISRKSPAREVGDMTSEAEKYAYKLAIERISGEHSNYGFSGWEARRGIELEPYARDQYTNYTGMGVAKAGLMLSDCRKFGYSSDGLLDDGLGLIEIKCPVDESKIIRTIQRGDVKEYYSQMQFGMHISDRKYCHLVQYAPQLANAGRDLHIVMVARDQEYIDTILEKLDRFEKFVSGVETSLRLEKNKSKYSDIEC